MLLITIGYGATCIAGQDENGTLSLTAVLPLSRDSVVLQKVGAMALQAMLLAIATMVCVVVGRQFDLSIPIAHLTGLTVGVALLGIDFGLCALAVGSITGSLGSALGMRAALAACSYLVSALPRDRMDSPCSLRFALSLDHLDAMRRQESRPRRAVLEQDGPARFRAVHAVRDNSTVRHPDLARGLNSIRGSHPRWSPR